MLRRLLPRVAPHGRQFSASAASEVFNELIRGEADPLKLSKLNLLQAVWEEQKHTLIALREGQSALREGQSALREAQSALDKALERAHESAERAHQTVQEKEALLKQQVTSLILDYLRAAGLNDARGLFEYLQDKILARDPATLGKEGSEGMWATVLAKDQQFEACLKKHLEPNTNLASHLAGTYQTLSDHVHSGKDLTASGGTIVFQPDFLTPQQCSSLVCMGTAAGVQVKPAPRTSTLRYK